MPSPALEPSRAVASARLIVIALGVGVLIFGGVAFGVSRSAEGGTDPETVSLLQLVATVLSFGAVVASWVLPGVVLRQIDPSLPPTNEADIARRCQVWVSSRILAAAAIEGPALFWCVILLLSGDVRNLIGAGAMTFLLFLRLPTEGDFEARTGVELDSS